MNETKELPVRCGWPTCVNHAEPDDSLCREHRNQADHGVQPLKVSNGTTVLVHLTEEEWNAKYEHERDDANHPCDDFRALHCMCKGACTCHWVQT